MALDKRITEMTEHTSPMPDDELAIVDDANPTATKKIKVSTLDSRYARKEATNLMTATNKFGNESNHLQIDNNGNLQAIGDATWFDDFRVEPTVREIGTKAPSYVIYKGGIYFYLFDKAVAIAEKEVNFKVQMPHGWLPGSSIHPHIHWVPTSTGSAGQKVRWGLEYTKANLGGVFGDTTTIYAEDPVDPPTTTPTVDTQYLTEFPDIDMTGNVLSSIILCRIFRNSSHANDTFAGDVGIVSIDIHTEFSRLGSGTEFAQ